MAFSSSESNSRPLIWAFRMRFSAARYSFRDRSSWSTVPGNVAQQLRPNHLGPFLIALTESWKKDCKCYGSFSESDLKRIEETASCAISIHSSFLTIRGNKPGHTGPAEVLLSNSQQPTFRTVCPVRSTFSTVWELPRLRASLPLGLTYGYCGG